MVLLGCYSEVGFGVFGDGRSRLGLEVQQLVVQFIEGCLKSRVGSKATFQLDLTHGEVLLRFQEPDTLALGRRDLEVSDGVVRGMGSSGFGQGSDGIGSLGDADRSSIDSSEGSNSSEAEGGHDVGHDGELHDLDDEREIYPARAIARGSQEITRGVGVQCELEQQ